LDEIKVSVIIPAYNVEAYIEESLSSVLGQTLREIEVIVVDDGSRDKTLEIIRGMAVVDERLRVITQQNSGISVARNRGAALARGRHLYFFDSDDLLHPRALELLHSSAEEKDCDLIRFFAGEFYHGQAGNTFAPSVSEVVCEEISRVDYLKNHVDYVVMVWQYFMRRDLWERLSYPFIEGYYSEDSEITPRLIVRSRKMGLIQARLHAQRIRWTSVSRSRISLAMIESSQVVSESLVRFLNQVEDRRLLPALHRLVANEVLASISNAYLLDRRERDGIRRRMSPLMHHFMKSDRRLHRLAYYGFKWFYWMTAYAVHLKHQRMRRGMRSNMKINIVEVRVD